MRLSHLIASATCIPLALLYYNQHGYDFMAFGFIATLYSLAFILFFRQYTYPSDLKGAFIATSGLVINFFVVFFVSSEGWLYSCYYIYFSILCVQSVVVVGLCVTLVIDIKTPMSIFNQNDKKKSDNLVAAAGILFLGSPLIIAPFFLGNLFVEGLNKLPYDQQFWIWLSFSIDLGTTLFVIWRIAFAKGYQKEINDRQNKLMHDWEGLINLLFLFGLFALIWIMFL